MTSSEISTAGILHRRIAESSPGNTVYAIADYTNYLTACRLRSDLVDDVELDLQAEINEASADKDAIFDVYGACENRALVHTLTDVTEMYSRLRQRGHTTSTIEGALNTNATVITHSYSMAHRLQLKYPGIKTESINSSTGLAKLEGAVVIDNCAIHVLLERALERIIRLEAEVAELHSK